MSDLRPAGHTHECDTLGVDELDEHCIAAQHSVGGQHCSEFHVDRPIQPSWQPSYQ